MSACPCEEREYAARRLGRLPLAEVPRSRTLDATGGMHERNSRQGRPGRLRQHQQHLLQEPAAAIPHIEVVACADLHARARPGPGRRVRRARACTRRRAAGRPRDRDRPQPDHPQGARRGGAGGAGGGQVASTTRSRSPSRARTARSMLALAKEKGLLRRRRARHLPGRRHPDLPQADRRRRDRRAGRRHGLHDRPRPRELAPRPRVLLQGRRRPDVRHGPLLPDRAGQPAGPGASASPARPASPSPSAPSPASRSTAR